MRSGIANVRASRAPAPLDVEGPSGHAGTVKENENGAAAAATAPPHGKQEVVLMRVQRSPEGIRQRHSRSCAAGGGRACSCKPTYEASVYSVKHGRKIRKTFPTLAAARSWRADATTLVRKGKLGPASKTTLREAWTVWLAGSTAGTIRTRDGAKYKPAAIRSYVGGMERHVLPELGALRLSSIGRNDIQDLVDGMLGQGLSPSTIRNAVMPIRVVLRRAFERGEIPTMPMHGVRLPRVEGSREADATAEDASRLIAALPEADRALWASAFYGGLRLGEIQALDWTNIDLDARKLRVTRSWDGTAKSFIEPKTKTSVRSIPILGPLRNELISQRLRSGRATGLVFGADGVQPFVASTVRRRAFRVWEEAGLKAVAFHACRHSFVSFAIAAGLNAKAISSYAGHSEISTTYDRYGHLLDGHEEQAASLLDRYLAENG
jgi:integrase